MPGLRSSASGKALLPRPLRTWANVFALSISLRLQLLCFCFTLFFTVLLCLSNLCSQILHKHVIRMAGVHLFLFCFCALINKLVEQLFQDFNNSVRLKFIAISFWSRDREAFSWILLKK